MGQTKCIFGLNAAKRNVENTPKSLNSFLLDVIAHAAIQAKIFLFRRWWSTYLSLSRGWQIRKQLRAWAWEELQYLPGKSFLRHMPCWYMWWEHRRGEWLRKIHRKITHQRSTQLITCHRPTGPRAPESESSYKPCTMPTSDYTK